MRKILLPLCNCFLFMELSAASLCAQDSSRVFDFIVPDDGDISMAVAAANSRPDTLDRYFIFVRRGDYVIPASATSTVLGMDGKEYPDPRTELKTGNVSIIGEGADFTSVKNTCPSVTVDGRWGPACPIEGLRKAYTLKNSGKNNYFQDIKLVNGMADATGRGEAYEEAGDRTIMKNVGLWGYQDTYCSNRTGGLHYFEGGVIRGRTDYICGKGDIYFNKVEFRQCDKGGYIIAPSNPVKYGYVMRDCIITGENPEIDGTFTFGRPWGKGTPTSYWINTICRVRPSDAGWAEMSGGWPARFAEIGSKDSRGNELYTGGRKKIWQFKDGEAHSNDPVLSENMAAQLTVREVLGGDGWDPETLAKDAPLPVNVMLTPLKSGHDMLSWDGSDESRGYAVCKDGAVWKFTTATEIEVPADGSDYSVRAVSVMGGLGLPVKAGKKVRLHTIGDSTMADYAEMTTMTRGWGEMLGEMFSDEVDVINYARGGRSAMSFIHEGRWDNVLRAIIPGDHVLIQFAHNDEHSGGKDGSDYRGTAPWTTYRDCLRKYVDDTRAAGGIPVLVTPIVRRYFLQDGTISAKGCHDLGNDGHSLNYVAVMKSVASEKDVPVIDMTALTKDYVETIGDTDSKSYLYVATDNTHTRAAGAAEFARIAADEMKRSGILGEYICTGKEISVNPSSLHVGEMYVGMGKTLAFDVVGHSTSVPVGKIVVKAPDGMTLSASPDGKRRKTLVITHTDGHPWQNTLYIHLNGKKPGTLNDNITVSYGNKTRVIPVRGVVSSISRIQPVSMDLKHTGSRGLLTIPEGFTFTTDGITAASWPEEIDEVNDRYVEYTMAATDKAVRIDGISLSVEGDICYRVSLARGKDFYPRTDIGESRVIGAKASKVMSADMYLEPGESLRLRVYPWNPDGGMADFDVKDVRIDGIRIL